MKKPVEIKATDVFLRNKVKGTIYGYTPALAKSKNVEEVSGKEAFPELFAPKSVKQKKNESVDLGELGTDPVDEKDKTPPELAAEASRGLRV